MRTSINCVRTCIRVCSLVGVLAQKWNQFRTETRAIITLSPEPFQLQLQITFQTI